MTMLTTLQERLEMYQQARSNASSSGDSSKARRLDRGLQVSPLCTLSTWFSWHDDMMLVLINRIYIDPS